MRAWLEREWQRLGGGALVFLPLALAFRAPWPRDGRLFAPRTDRFGRERESRRATSDTPVRRVFGKNCHELRMRG